jgi:hypothetical protein
MLSKPDRLGLWCLLRIAGPARVCQLHTGLRRSLLPKEHTVYPGGYGESTMNRTPRTSRSTFGNQQPRGWSTDFSELTRDPGLLA